MYLQVILCDPCLSASEVSRLGAKYKSTLPLHLPLLSRECLFLSFLFIWGDTRSLRMPALRSASQAGPMRNPREGTSVVLRDTIMLT